jgi:hypothetical protein
VHRRTAESVTHNACTVRVQFTEICRRLRIFSEGGTEQQAARGAFSAPCIRMRASDISAFLKETNPRRTHRLVRTLRSCHATRSRDMRLTLSWSPQRRDDILIDRNRERRRRRLSGGVKHGVAGVIAALGCSGQDTRLKRPRVALFTGLPHTGSRSAAVYARSHNFSAFEPVTISRMVGENRSLKH